MDVNAYSSLLSTTLIYPLGCEWWDNKLLIPPAFLCGHYEMVGTFLILWSQRGGHGHAESGELRSQGF